MARYDRIARIDPPARDDAYTGWLALRDLAERERDGELGRRARLRFLAARLIHRLARKGDDIDATSLQQQSDAVREELGQLPSRDRERQLLAELLKHAPTGDVAAIVRAGLDLADDARDGDAPFAAEEFYRTCMQLAESNGLDDLRSEGVRGLEALGRTVDA